MAEKFIQNMHLKKGDLHEMLNVPEGEKIPAKQMQQALHSDSALERKRAHTAETLEKFHK
jgi:hypothetical protein